MSEKMVEIKESVYQDLLKKSGALYLQCGALNIMVKGLSKIVAVRKIDTSEVADLFDGVDLDLKTGMMIVSRVNDLLASKDKSIQKVMDEEKRKWMEEQKDKIKEVVNDPSN